MIVALTGSIGSGKSTVANYFAKLGIDVIDADQIAREVIQPNTPTFQEVVNHFGKKILDKDQHLNRTKLREIIFTHAEERDWLEKLLHPLITKVIQQRIQTSPSPYCIVVIPLLFEKGAHLKVNRVLVIDSSEELQKKRVQKRDKLTFSQVDAILKTQINRDARLNKADDIIHNEGSLDDLKLQVDQLHKKYLELAT